MSFCVAPCGSPSKVVKEEVEGEAALRPNPSEEEPLEINYDTSSLTYLYQAIEDKAFMAAIDFLESNRPEVYDECRTWVTRYELRNPKKIRWSQLPLHAAIVFGGPPRLIELLVKVYPRACRCTDDQSMLPVHLALRFGSNDAILWRLLKEFPEAINAKDAKGRFPLQLAAQGDGWKRGEIISMFEKNVRLKIMKADADHRVQASEALLNAQISKNEQLEAENKALKEQYENMQVETIKTKKEYKKVEAQRDHLDSMRLAKRRIIRKPRDPRDKEIDEEEKKEENDGHEQNENKDQEDVTENETEKNVTETNESEKKKKKRFLDRFRKKGKVTDVSAAKEVDSDGKTSNSDQEDTTDSGEDADPAADKEENPASADDVVESLNNLESSLVETSN
mmetsp:Transcript_32828/g.48594  ORF Transcript_32828/g.48594 Transcript_32828/m.48594 type:complete len:394 (-) Transcript_32828:223-1404(-)|eukprot:CAMPEP_0194199494 /NCGR_PEP_ID=MMETSP0156-20130528/488_1 /TAXON_ID=33649 /ORGANISM="Thalassionema nitzschioides, Strain L26-B" /LENGTH=393 /DNA_ID=CAMNT_0038924393 /DNA_START=73 /DNA_END=1254 /DNA_ORIENTATION=+